MPRYKAPEGPIDYDIELDLTNEHLDKLESTELRRTLQVRQSLRKVLTPDVVTFASSRALCELHATRFADGRTSLCASHRRLHGSLWFT